MRIELPSLWKGVGILKGKRKPVMTELFDIIEVEIPEISGTHVPLCVTSEFVDVRYFDDGFWYPVSILGRYLKPGDDEPPHVEELKALQNIKRSKMNVRRLFANTFASTVFGMTHTTLWHSDYFDPESFKQIDTSSREDALAKSELFTRNTLLIDGAIWIRSDNPVMKIAPRPQRNPDCDIVPRGEQGIWKRPRDSMIFDLSMDIGVVRHLAREHANFLDDTMNLNIPDFEILMPEVMENVANSTQLMRDAIDAAKHWWEEMPEHLAKVNRSQLSLLSEMLERIEDLEGEPNDTRLAELEELIKEIVNSNMAPSEPREKLRRALARFEEYMMNEDLEIDTPFGAAP